MAGGSDGEQEGLGGAVGFALGLHTRLEGFAERGEQEKPSGRRREGGGWGRSGFGIPAGLPGSAAACEAPVRAWRRRAARVCRGRAGGGGGAGARGARTPGPECLLPSVSTRSRRSFDAGK